MTEAEFVNRLQNIQARVFIVGGWVRDYLRGQKPHDKDYMVAGITERDFQKAFPEARKTGKSFPVYLLNIAGNTCEVAFARKEKKTGQGYLGFSIDADARVTPAEDLYRRDTTMNSIAMELPNKIIYDPYDGQAAIKAEEIRAVSAHFIEDPVRALRASRQAAELGFTISDATYEYMRQCQNELASEPAERKFNELRRALKAKQPSVFFRALQRADLLTVTFPELAVLIGKTQPKEYHPEGDAFEHTMLVLDKVAAANDSLLARFCALTHDLGKGRTPEAMLPHHYGHEQTGLAVIKAWNERMTLPKDWLQGSSFVISQHMRAPRLNKASKIVDLLMAIDKSVLSIAEFNAVILADNHSLPQYLVRAEEILSKLKAINGSQAPAGLAGKKIGEWLRTARINTFQKL